MLSLIFFVSQVFAQSQDRQMLLDSIAEIQPARVEIVNVASATAAQVALVKFYSDKIQPAFEAQEILVTRYKGLKAAYDRALFENESEREQWKLQMRQIHAQAIALEARPDFREDIRQFYQLSRGLKGELVEAAEQLYHEVIELGSNEKDLPILEEIQKLMVNIESVSNSSPVNPGVSAAVREGQKIQGAFGKKKISFLEAEQQLKDLLPRGLIAHGQYVATHARESLTRVAILRTQLAKQKGFKNWAEMSLAKEGDSYRQDLRSVAARIAFLEAFLEQTSEVVHQFYSQVGRRLGAPEGPWNTITSELFLPGGQAEFSSHFPVSAVDAAVRSVLKQSGFSSRVVDAVGMDSFPREGKHSHAYMMPVRLPRAKVIRIDAAKLSLLPNSDSEIDPALIQIVQNFRADGLDSMRTGLHENGHAMEYSHRQPSLIGRSNNSWSETHSYFMEKFLEEPEFLLNISRKNLSLTQARILVRERQLIDRIRFRGNVMNALFDLMLWNHEYREGEESYVDRSLRLRRELFSRYTPFRLEEINGIDQAMAGFSTGHFYGGLVRYIGYVLANIAVNLSHEKMLADLKRDTGRASLYLQDSLAERLINAYYRDGYTKPFPSPIEQFTGRPFEPELAAKEFNTRLKCEIELQR